MASRLRRGWLSKLLDRGAGEDDSEYELVILEGLDQGRSYPVDETEIQIGRSMMGARRQSGIALADRSVSAKQALLSREDGRLFIQHLPSATNPTLVNGRRIRRKRLRHGDRIALGLVVLELRAIARPSPALEAGSGHGPAGPAAAGAALALREGIPGLVGTRFELDRQRTSIGRDQDCDVVVDMPAVSRHHAALVWEGDHLVLVHESSVNPTFVNGMQITDRRHVFGGDEIRIADRVTFDVVLERAAEEARGPAPAPRDERDETLVSVDAATRYTPPPPQAGPTEPDALLEAPTVLDAPVDPREEATRISRVEAPDPQEQATLISSVEAPGPRKAPDERPVPEGDVGEDSEATRIDDVPGPDADLAFAATRVIPAVEPDRYADAAKTRIAPAPSASESESSDRTRVAPGPAAPEEAGRPAVDRDRYADAAKTQIAPAPSASESESSDRTRVAPGPAAPEEAGEEADDARTMIRPSPFADTAPTREREAAATRVVDLDEDLADEERTVIRPAARFSDAEATVVRRIPDDPSPEPLDADATVIRPVPGRDPAETVILEGDGEDTSDED